MHTKLRSAAVVDVIMLANVVKVLSGLSSKAAFTDILYNMTPTTAATAIVTCRISIKNQNNESVSQTDKLMKEICCISHLPIKELLK